MSTFQIFPLRGNPRFNTFCHRTLLSVFRTNGKDQGFCLSINNIFFHGFVCCIFPGNNRIICLRTSVLLSAIPPPHALILQKLFQYILNNTLWVIVVVNAAGQISKQETGKSAEIIPIKWDWMMENKARGDMKGGSESALLKLASHHCLFWLLWLKMDSWRLAQSHRLILILSQPRFNPLELFLAWCTGVIIGLLVTGFSCVGLCWGERRTPLHADRPRVRSRRGLRIHTGAAAIGGWSCCWPVIQCWCLGNVNGM